MNQDPIIQALFNQQRIQIMHLAVHHNEYSDAYLYAWEKGVYPIMEDTDGSVLQMPHEVYQSFFSVSKDKVEKLLNLLCDKWDSKVVPTFYELEDLLSGDFDRSELIKVCKYLKLQDCFDEAFWSKLITPMQHPSEASSIAREFNRETDIYFQ